MQVANGIDINPEWKDSLAWSTDGIKWRSVQLDGIQVDYHSSRQRSGALNENYPQVFEIILTDQAVEKLRFRLPIDNQPTWTNTPTGAKQALDDITSWLNVKVDNQEQMIALLTQIEDNTDEVESLLTQIENNTDDVEQLLTDLLTCCGQVNANTDELEAKLDTVISYLTLLDGKDFATETTLAALKAVADTIKTDTANLDVPLSTRATEATLLLVRDYLASIDSKDFATETTLLLVKGVLDTVSSTLTSIDSKDFATETTLAALKAVIDLIKLDTSNLDVQLSTRATELTLSSLLAAFNAEDFATETTLAALKAVVDLIKLDTANLDVALSTRATEATLLLIEAITSQLTFTGGNLNVNATLINQNPLIAFLKDLVNTDVSIDTVTPANNEPLPTALYNNIGLQGTATNPLNIAIRDSSTGARAIVDQNGAIKLGEAIILCGDVLYGQPLSNFLWYDLSINGGVTFGAAGEQRLETGTTANGEIILQSRKKSRFMISQFNISHFGIQLDPLGNLSDPNTITEFGNVTFLDDNGILNTQANGIFFRVQGDPTTPVWSIVSIKNGVEIETPLASWNGAQAANFNPSPNLSVYEIQYNAGTAIFFQGSNFVHRLAGLTSTYAATYNFPVALRIRNINGNTTNRSFGSRAAGAYRLGEERGELIARALTVSTLLKTGAGYVGSAYLSRTGGGGGNSGIAIIYDGINATGIPIGRIDVSTDDVKGVTLNGTFSNGLYVDIIGSGTNTLTINFE